MLLEQGVSYDQCIFLAKFCLSSPCFIPYSKAKFACYSRCFLTCYFCIPVPYNVKDIFFGCQFQNVLQICIELFNFGFFSITGWGKDLDYCDIEWFAFSSVQFSCSVMSGVCLGNKQILTDITQSLTKILSRSRRSNQSILKKINSEYSLEVLMLKLKLQFFGCLM